MLQNFKITIAYDGTNYHGFQKQQGTGLKTIQEVLEDCLSHLSGEKIKIIGAGRTDAGVHALNQVINFTVSNWKIPAGRIVPALNGLLPDDIVALTAAEMPIQFHARFGAKAKTYVYTVYNHPLPSPFWRLYSYFVPRPLDVAACVEAANFLEGQHDFASFMAMANGTQPKNTVRTLYRAKVTQKDKFIYFIFQADGFLYRMVRLMSGTLLEVGKKKLAPQEIINILNSCDRTLAGPTVPAHGLCLVKVEY
ncbi:MAG TPA: tRNA pseudouridine(38-40) synthase TruA [Desulfotomaculum sp.]|nr:tRNA pseudouridine(38-40) synthase TruA [Desulfotomaculum sp.]